MSGVTVIRRLLAAAGAVTAIAPAARIKAGVLPLNIALPAVGITSISAVRRNTVSMGESKTLVTERVQVSPLVSSSADGGGDYTGLIALLHAIRQACPNQRGTVGSVEVVSILPDVEGPDLEDTEAGYLMRSQDFFVAWLESR